MYLSVLDNYLKIFADPLEANEFRVECSILEWLCSCKVGAIPPSLIYCRFLFWVPEIWVPARVSFSVFPYLIAFGFREIKEGKSNKKKISVCVCLELHSIWCKVWSKDRPGYNLVY